MKKLELSHLAGYLPYGLKIYACHNEYLLELEEDCNSEGISVRETIENDHKPILRPLSDLTKEIEVNGEKFVSIVELAKLSMGYKFIEKPLIKDVAVLVDFFKYSERFVFSCNVYFNFNLYNHTALKTVPLINQRQLFEKLLEWHFDIYNLIPQNLAIDINTI